MESFIKREIEEGIDEYRESLEKKGEEVLKLLLDDETMESLEKEEKLQEIIYSILEEEGYDEIIGIGKKALSFYGEEYGIDDIEDSDESKTENAVLLTEAINWGAKTINESFYKLKPAMIISAWKKGAILGVEEEPNRWPIYYLHGKNVGVASFHDPNEEVSYINDHLNKKRNLKMEIPNWTHGWSGIPRQNEAFNLIRAMSRQINEDEERYYLRKMAVKTSPGSSFYEKYKNSKRPWGDYNDGPIGNKIEIKP